MHTIAYVSAAKSAFSEEALIELLQKSRTNNELFEITEMLLYKERTFMQIIEGSKNSIDNLYRNICGDPTHYNIHTLIDEPCEVRSFPDWQMAFINMSESTKEIPGFSDFMKWQDNHQRLEKPNPKELLFSFRNSFRHSPTRYKI